MRAILTALALVAGLAAPASAESKQDIIAGAVLVSAAANSCPEGTVPESIMALVLFNYSQAMGLSIDAAANRLDLMGAIMAMRLKEEGKHDDMCLSAKRAALAATTF